MKARLITLWGLIVAMTLFVRGGAQFGVVTKNISPVTDRATTATMPAPLPAVFAQQGNGELIAYIGPDGNVWLTTLDGGNPTRLTEDATFDITEEGIRYSRIKYIRLGWAPNGRMLAVQRREVSIPVDSIWVYSIPGASLQQVIPDSIYGFAWSPDSAAIVFSRGEAAVQGDTSVPIYGLWQLIVDTGQMSEIVPSARGYSLVRPRWSPNGQYLSFEEAHQMEGSGLFAVFDIDTGSYIPWADTVGAYDWAPDSTHLVYDGNIYIGGPGLHIWQADARGNNRVSLTSAMPTSADLSPTYSPSGDRIAFVRETYGEYMSIVSSALWITDANGGNPRQLASFDASTDEGEVWIDAVWAPDGHQLAVSKSTYLHGEIFVVDAVTGETQKLADGHEAVWAPDGQRLAVWRGPSRPGEVLVVDVTTGETQKIADGSNPVWQPLISDSVDLSISEITPIQVLEDQPLVVGKATAVKVVINKSGSGSAEDVQVRLTRGTDVLTSFYVSEPDNWDGQFRLQQDNTTYPLNFTATETSKTIYFFDDALAPTAAGPYNVTAEADPSNRITETVETNNTGSASDVTAYEARWGWPFTALRLRYIPVEQPRSQAVINYVETGTDFITSTYPVAASKLQYEVSTSSFSRIYREPNDFGLRMALAMLRVMGFLADPTADRIIGITPAGWLHDNYPFIPQGATGYGVWPNGIGPLAPAVFVEIAGIGTIAHEVGHAYGLWVGKCPDGQGQREEYDQDCDGVLDDYGNVVYGGLRVSDRTVMNNGDEKEGGARHGVYCFMGTAHYEPSTIDRFVCTEDYQALVARSGATVQAMAQSDSQGVVLVSGLIGKDDTSEFLDWYRLQEGATDEPEPGPYILKALAEDGGILYEQPFAMTFDLMGAIDSTLEEAPFAFAIPFIPGTVEFELQHEGQTLTTKSVSAHAPIIEVLTPNGGEAVAGSNTIEWAADDADGDTLSYAVLLSTDNGATWSTAAFGLTTTVHSLDFSALPPGTDNLVKIIATDGINTGQDVSDGPFTIGEVHPDGEEEVPRPQPGCCTGLWGLVALPVSMVMLLVRKRLSTQSRDAAQ